MNIGNLAVTRRKSILHALADAQGASQSERKPRTWQLWWQVGAEAKEHATAVCLPPLTFIHHWR